VLRNIALTSWFICATALQLLGPTCARAAMLLLTEPQALSSTRVDFVEGVFSAPTQDSELPATVVPTRKLVVFTVPVEQQQSQGGCPETQLEHSDAFCLAKLSWNERREGRLGSYLCDSEQVNSPQLSRIFRPPR